MPLFCSHSCKTDKNTLKNTFSLICTCTHTIYTHIRAVEVSALITLFFFFNAQFTPEVEIARRPDVHFSTTMDKRFCSAVVQTGHGSAAERSPFSFDGVVHAKLEAARSLAPCSDRFGVSSILCMSRKRSCHYCPLEF